MPLVALGCKSRRYFATLWPLQVKPSALAERVRVAPFATISAPLLLTVTVSLAPFGVTTIDPSDAYAEVQPSGEDWNAFDVVLSPAS
jgi:hypothetical protein